MSLRARLLSGMVVLVAAGLAVAAVATYAEQRSFLLDRVDQQAQAALLPLSFQLRLAREAAAPARGGAPGATPSVRRTLPRVRTLGLGPAAALPPGTFGALVGPDGTTVLRRRTFSYGETMPAAPRLPSPLPLSRPGHPPTLFTIAGGPSDQRYRAVAIPAGRDTIVAAVPLREVQDTLHRLIVVEAMVGAGVILGMVALGWVVIRIGLRPLERIGRVASEIAGGDLSRRVSPADSRTEVGRLGRSLNEMLGQIEAAFGDRRRSEERLRRFLADASHELRTPLASIRGYAELFRLGAAEDPETLARALARIEAEAARMGVLVEDLLMLVSLDEAPPRPPVSVDVCELIAHAAQDARVLAPDRELSTECRGPVTVSGDVDRLRALLSNLVGNAILHTPAGTAIELAAARRDDQVVITVRDHGAGLPQGAGEQLFERFWRSENGRARGRAGAGLGLAIVRAIADGHGGTVSAADAPGGGAVFSVSLPAADPAAGSQESLSVLTSGSYLHRGE